MIRQGFCKHSVPYGQHLCRAGIVLKSWRDQGTTLPCADPLRTDCALREEPSEEDLRHVAARAADQEADTQRRLALLDQGLSFCCEAPLDERQVITSGKYKGHGPRFCSKCKAFQFQV